MEHIINRSNSKGAHPSWPKRLLHGAIQVTHNIKDGLEKLLIHRTDPKWSKLLEQIRNRIQNPRYLDSNDAIRDFESLVFVVYRDKLFAGKTEREAYQIRKDLLKFILFLRGLSNSSGLIKKRQSGYSAFSHWMDAVYIYLENDPHPTIQGIREIAAHDSLEDPDFSVGNRSAQIRWATPEKVRKQLIKYGGEDTVHRVEMQFTKPGVTAKHYAQSRDLHGDQESLLDDTSLLQKFFVLGTPTHHQEARIERNRRFLENIREKTDDATFRKKLADTLSNIRNIDAYILLEKENSQNQIDGKKKMERKCGEIVEFLLPRAREVAPSYYVQLVSEVESLKATYHLTVSLHGNTSSSTAFQKAIEQSTRQGIEFKVVRGRAISEHVTTHRVTLEARKKM